MKKILSKIKNLTVKGFSKIHNNQDGIGSIELVLILLVLVGLIVVFRENIMSIIDTVFNKITAQINNF